MKWAQAGEAKHISDDGNCDGADDASTGAPRDHIEAAGTSHLTTDAVAIPRF
ncbi:MAG: hypothetical protein M3N46_02180 [Actinomycetota bacterium]|nr:hypothetical protein [Actinomycetota bacterium]